MSSGWGTADVPVVRSGFGGKAAVSGRPARKAPVTIAPVVGDDSGRRVGTLACCACALPLPATIPATTRISPQPQARPRPGRRYGDGSALMSQGFIAKVGQQGNPKSPEVYTTYSRC